jgi:hypothetical protein
MQEHEPACADRIREPLRDYVVVRDTSKLSPSTSVTSRKAVHDRAVSVMNLAGCSTAGHSGPGNQLGDDS